MIHTREGGRKWKWAVVARFLKASHIEFFALDRAAAEDFERELRAWRVGVFGTKIISLEGGK